MQSPKPMQYIFVINNICQLEIEGDIFLSLSRHSYNVYLTTSFSKRLSINVFPTTYFPPTSFSQRLSYNVLLTTNFSKCLSQNVLLTTSFFKTSYSQYLSHYVSLAIISHNVFLTATFLQCLSLNTFLTTFFSQRLSHNVVITLFY